MTAFLSNNDFSVAYSGKRVLAQASSLDQDWQDAGVCIDTIRNALFRAGWRFVNPYKTGGGVAMPLGSAILVHPYVAGTGYMDFYSIGSLPNWGDREEAGTWLPLRSLLSGPTGLYLVPSQGQWLDDDGHPYDGPGIRVALDFVVDSGFDTDLPQGAILSQVRGLSASQHAALTPGIAYFINQFFWFYDRAGHFSAFTSFTTPFCSEVNRYGPSRWKTVGVLVSGIDGFIAAITSKGCEGLASPAYGWKFRKVPEPHFGHPGHLDWVATTGRDSISGEIDQTDDMTGTIGNNPLVSFWTPISPYFGGKTTDYAATGGGWVMSSPGGEITVAITQNRASLLTSHILFQFADSRSSIPYDEFFYGEVKGAVEYVLAGGINSVVYGAPILPLYKIIASTLGFSIIDVANTNNDGRGGFNSLMVTCPRLIDEQITGGARSSVLIVGPHNLNHGMSWLSTCSIANDGKPGQGAASFATFAAGFGFSNPGMVTDAFESAYPLQTSNGRVFAENAWVMAAPLEGVEAQILGRIPDALVLTGSNGAPDVGQAFSFEGHRFVCISTQGPGTEDRSYPVCSLWLAYD